MKAFLFQKNEDAFKYKSDSNEENYKTELIKIEAKSNFNEFTIINPKNTNKIYTINNLMLRFSERNSIYLKIGTTDLDLYCYRKEDKKCVDELKIIYSMEKDRMSSGIEINAFSNNNGEYKELLENQYIILLPRGSLTVSLEEKIKTVYINISYIVETI